MKFYYADLCESIQLFAIYVKSINVTQNFNIAVNSHLIVTSFLYCTAPDIPNCVGNQRDRGNTHLYG